MASPSFVTETENFQPGHSSARFEALSWTILLVLVAASSKSIILFAPTLFH